MSKRLAILASGEGTNLQAIIDAIEQGRLCGASICLVASDVDKARALERARGHRLPTVALERSAFQTRDAFETALIGTLDRHQPDWIVLAGFMRVLSAAFVEHFNGKLINLHPSLLPAFPGLDAVQQALDYGVKVTGCTVHFVSAEVDAGPIIIQRSLEILPGESAESLATRLHALEHETLVTAIDQLLHRDFRLTGRKVEFRS